MVPMPHVLAAVALPDVAAGLVLVGFLLICLECNVPGKVVPGCVGVLLLTLGLFELRSLPHVAPWILGMTSTIFLTVTGWLGYISLLARRNKFVLGTRGMVGKVATAVGSFEQNGTVQVGGELWPAALEHGAPAVAVGATVVVTATDARTLLVRPVGLSPRTRKSATR